MYIFSFLYQRNTQSLVDAINFKFSITPKVRKHPCGSWSYIYISLIRIYYDTVVGCAGRIINSVAVP
jgi:hypothetical protein